MKGIFQIDGPLMRFLNTLADMITVSILWLVCSLPVITMGASTTALYAVMMRYTEDDSGLIRQYLKAFRENLRKGSVAGLLLMLVGLLLFFDLQIISGLARYQQAARIAVWVGIGMYAIVFVHTFPLLACFEQTLPQTLKNALFIGLSNLSATLLLLLVHVLPLIAAVLNPNMFIRYALPILTFMGIGILTFLNSRILKRIYAKYKN